MKKLVTIIGTRPQFVKAAVVSKKLKGKVNEVLVHTGQHYDQEMSGVFFRDFDMKPDYSLNINNLLHGAIVGRTMEEVEKILLREMPDAVLIYGDSNSTLAGALAAKKLKIKVVHIEAGERSGNMDMPEEVNRVLVDRISDLLFCSSLNSRNNLLNEKCEGVIVHSGDVMKDLFLLNFKSKIISPFNEYVLCTIHRDENLNRESLKGIIESLDEINKEVEVIFPMHPHTKNCLLSYGLKASFPFYNSLNYTEIHRLLYNSKLVVTDSGGLQKEAYWAGKYCLTWRRETEWVDLVKLGCNVLINSSNVMKVFRDCVNRKFDFSTNLYGNGHAGGVISDNIYNFLNQ